MCMDWWRFRRGKCFLRQSFVLKGGRRRGAGEKHLCTNHTEAVKRFLLFKARKMRDTEIAPLCLSGRFGFVL